MSKRPIGGSADVAERRPRPRVERLVDLTDEASLLGRKLDLPPWPDGVYLEGRSAVAKAFGERLRHILAEHRLNQSEFARRVAKHGLKKFERSSVSGYVKGKTIPLPPQVAAMAAALHLSSEELLPSATAISPPPSRDLKTPIFLWDGGETMEVYINQRLPSDIATEIMNLVKSARERPTTNS